MSLSITNLTKGKVASKDLPFLDIADFVLGKKYKLSLVWADHQTSQRLNKKYRQKDHATNILSFELDKNYGEIFIDPQTAKDQAKDFDRSYENFLVFLFIHGCCHLKGLDHETEAEAELMEQAEIKIRQKFGI